MGVFPSGRQAPLRGASWVACRRLICLRKQKDNVLSREHQCCAAIAWVASGPSPHVPTGVDAKLHLVPSRYRTGVGLFRGMSRGNQTLTTWATAWMTVANKIRCAHIPGMLAPRAPFISVQLPCGESKCGRRSLLLVHPSQYHKDVFCRDVVVPSRHGMHAADQF
jgi:hypothetical protein